MRKIAEQGALPSTQAAENVGKYYDWFSESIPEFEHLRYLRTYKPIIEDFISHLPKGGYVIDLGCGLGLVSHILFTRGMKGYGLESSLGTITKTKTYFPFLDIRHGDIREFEAEESVHGIFDRLAVMYLPEHEIRVLLKRIYRELASGGVFQTTFEESLGGEQGWYPYETAHTATLSDGSTSRMTVPVCVTYFTKEVLVELLMDTGFDVLKVWNYREPETSKRNLITVLCGKSE